MQDIKEYIKERAREAKLASRALAKVSTTIKDRALIHMAEILEKKADDIIEENKKDLINGEGVGLNSAILDRLRLDKKRIGEMAKGLREIAVLPDPVGEITKLWKRPNGMLVGRMRVPIGLICIIYESRPNVTADAAALCIKSGNGVILRGGSESINSNIVIARLLSEAGMHEGIPEGAITLVETTERGAVFELLRQEEYVDLVIPRGGEGLIRMVAENARMAVIKHYKGVCHTYVDIDADLEKAEKICFNAKVQRPGTCNAMETLLVHQGVAEIFLPRMIKRLKDAGCEVRGCKKTVSLNPGTKEAEEEDWGREYLDLILNIKIVSDMDEAISHITRYGSEHSDSIVTENYSRAHRFLREVDSSAVFVNASTRLNDGYQFGLGAEIGISTTRIHARGPMGLEELTTTKFIVMGDGQIRE